MFRKFRVSHYWCHMEVLIWYFRQACGKDNDHCMHRPSESWPGRAHMLSQWSWSLKFTAG